MQNPPQMQKIKALLKAEQTAVTRQREELLNQFRCPLTRPLCCEEGACLCAHAQRMCAN